MLINKRNCVEEILKMNKTTYIIINIQNLNYIHILNKKDKTHLPSSTSSDRFCPHVILTPSSNSVKRSE